MSNKSFWSIFSKKPKEISSKPEGAVQSLSAKSKQDMIFWAVTVSLLALLIIYLKIRANMEQTNTAEYKETPINLAVASKALDTEKMWRNYFEDKLIENSSKSNEKLQLIENSINEQAIAHQNQLKSEIEKLKSQLQYLTEEQAISRREISAAQLKVKEDTEINRGEYKEIETKITVNNMERDEQFDRPKSSRSYIPETAYIKGVLLGGIVVSTSIGSSSEPVPVIIRITDAGNLPKNFVMDLTHCHIMGGSYGDLSSERAIIRAETLSCKDPLKELIYTTKIAGMIFGDDGMNGIKGKVIQTSSKHLSNAVMGSMLSGFATTAKGQDQMIFTSAGAMNAKAKGIGGMAQEGALAGASNAAEKIADYYIKQAENMSPVLVIPGGTRVDVVFTKGVYFSALDVQSRLEKSRVDNSRSGGNK